MPLATELDVQAVLPTIRVPTLILQHTAQSELTMGGKEITVVATS
jgi:hypothetical protein